MMTCPNILYNTIDRITDWDAGLPSHFEVFDYTEQFYFGMCRYEVCFFYIT